MGPLLWCIGLAAPLLAQTQIELTLEARERAEAAEEKVNASYERLMPWLDGEAQALLAKSQAEWVRYRDSQCAFEGDWYRGGSASPYQYNLCAIRLNQARWLELQKAIEFHELD